MNKLLEIMNHNNIKINIATLCIGVKLKYISHENFKNYSLMSLLNGSDIAELVTCNLFESKDEFDLCNICNDILDRLDNNQKSREVSKWLFACLKHVQETIDNPQELLQKISEIYADFYYPPSMQDIIYYLPPSNNYDPTKHTLEENRTRLIKLFNEYLITLQKIVTSNNHPIVIHLDSL